MVQTELIFDGAEYKPCVDQHRLTGQLFSIFNCISDQRWYTLKDIEMETGFPQASISAQLRNLRKERFGGWVIDRKRSDCRESGLFYYRLNVNGVKK